MITTAIDDLVTVIKKVSDYPDNSVFRGEPGKVNVVKSKGCLVMPDFKNVPVNFPNEDGVLPKQFALIANCFVIVAMQKSLITAEDLVTDLALKTIYQVHDEELQIDMNGNNKFYKWELTDIEWLDRSASLCSIVLEFSVNLQL